MDAKNPTTQTEDEKSELLATRQLELLKKLNYSEEFCLWRDEFVKPVLEQLKLELASDDKLDEATLRSKLKSYYWLEEFFYNMFDKANFQLKQK